MVRRLRWYLRPILWLIGIAGILVLVAVISSFWQYTGWYPRVFGATLTVDGAKVSGSRLYMSVRRDRAVIVRRESGLVESYFVALDPERTLFVWRCQNSAFSLVPGFAFGNHVQFGKGCLSQNLAADNSTGRPVSPSKAEISRNLRTESGLIEFTADDGMRLRLKW